MATFRLPFLPTSFSLPAAASTPITSHSLDMNPPSQPVISSSSISCKQSLYSSSAMASGLSVASNVPQPERDEDWLYQHRLCETAMLVTRLVFCDGEEEECNADQDSSAAGSMLLGGDTNKRRRRVGRGRSARSAEAVRQVEAATREWYAPFRPNKGHNNSRAPIASGNDVSSSFHLPSAPCAAGELASPFSPSSPPDLGYSSMTTTIATINTYVRTSSSRKEGWMEGVSKRAFYKRRRKARQAAEYAIDCVLQEVESRVVGLAGIESQEE